MSECRQLVFKYVYTNTVPRQPLSEEEHDWGSRLAKELRDLRNSLEVSAEQIAVDSGVSVETVRRIERGLVPSPGFFTIFRLAGTLQVGLDQLAVAATGTKA